MILRIEIRFEMEKKPFKVLASLNGGDFFLGRIGSRSFLEVNWPRNNCWPNQKILDACYPELITGDSH